MTVTTTGHGIDEVARAMHPTVAVELVRRKIHEERKANSDDLVMWMFVLQRLLSVIDVSQFSHPILSSEHRKEILEQDLRVGTMSQFGDLSVFVPTPEYPSDQLLHETVTKAAAKEADEWHPQSPTRVKEWTDFAAFWEWLFKPRK